MVVFVGGEGTAGDIGDGGDWPEGILAGPGDWPEGGGRVGRGVVLGACLGRVGATAASTFPTGTSAGMWGVCNGGGGALEGRALHCCSRRFQFAASSNDSVEAVLFSALPCAILLACLEICWVAKGLWGT